MTNITNIHIFVTTEPNRIGFSLKCSFIILKHIQIDLQFLKLLMLNSDCNFFGGQ